MFNFNKAYLAELGLHAGEISRERVERRMFREKEDAEEEMVMDIKMDDKLELEDSTELNDTEFLNMTSLQSSDVSEIFEANLDSLDSLESLEMNDLNITVTDEKLYSIIQEDCGEEDCSFLFADSGLSDQAVGKYKLILERFAQRFLSRWNTPGGRLHHLHDIPRN